jgi:hypothetical protein
MAPGVGAALPPLPGTLPGGNSEVISWVREHGKVVDSQLWQPAALAEPVENKNVVKKDDAQRETATIRLPFRKPELYDCRPDLGLKEASALE